MNDPIEVKTLELMYQDFKEVINSLMTALRPLLESKKSRYWRETALLFKSLSVFEFYSELPYPIF